MRKRFKHIISILFVCTALNAQSQQTSTLYGVIRDNQNNTVENANIIISNSTIGTSSDKMGRYLLQIPSETQISLVISYLGFNTDTLPIFLKAGEKKIMNHNLSEKTTLISTFTIQAERERTTSMVNITIEKHTMLPSVAGGIESVIKTLPGVSSNNELSSQYSVRGGNYDENLVYVNDIEIYRPFLIRSGQQEGLSFINPDMVSGLRFSSGGFDVAYGDKMSSVLDISYRKPNSWGGGSSLSFLGGDAYLEGISKNNKFTHITGVRYKTSQYLLKSLDVKGEYHPSFMDMQTYMTYTISDKTDIAFLGNIAQNKYTFIPEEQTTAFGTTQKTLKLRIYYDGSEVDKFATMLGALSLTHRPNKNLSIKWINSLYNASEQETFDIQGQYLINEVDQSSAPQTGSDSAMNLGVGTFLNHARNYLDATVFSSSLRGTQIAGLNRIRWEARYQREIIGDDLHEWQMLDSAGYSLPYSDQTIKLQEVAVAKNNLATNRLSGFIQESRNFSLNGRILTLVAGLRGAYWSFNDELNISPRASASFKPMWRRDYVFRFATGYYYQPPFYKEFRKSDGTINTNIKSQRSLHFVIGSDHSFTAWNRPFRFITEAYYKKMDNLIPYKIDNVRIRYSAENLASGYASGIDMKVNGEFVKGAESWFSLSFMNTKEDVKGDFHLDSLGNSTEIGSYPRPSDQLINFGLHFQDYFPNNPTWRMQLTFMYGSRLPYTSPYSKRYDDFFRMPPYRRVDVGLYKVIISDEVKPKNLNTLKHIKGMWFGIEIFNLFNISNTISYLWVRTVSTDPSIPDMFAVPNYLTSRRLNVKFTIKF